MLSRERFGQMQKRKGMHPKTWQRWGNVIISAQVPWNNITQTVGSAPESAGFHAADGTYALTGKARAEYCACFDVSVWNPTHLTGAQVGRICLTALSELILVFWRTEAQNFSTAHLHCIDVTLPQKQQTVNQVLEWLKGGDGLVGSHVDPFWFHYMGQKSYKVHQEHIRDALRKSNSDKL